MKSTGMQSEYISRIIRRKLTENEGIDREDIINVLDMQSKNMYLNIEEYQKLINDCVVAYLNSQKNGIKLSNPKILNIFENLASSYKVQGDYKRAKEIYEQALGIKSLENTPEYAELKSKYENFLEFLKMMEDFEPRRFNSFEDLKKALIITYTDDPIFVQGKGGPRFPNPSPNPQDKYVMPVELRIKGIERLRNALHKDNPDFEMVNCETGKDGFAGYIIIKIENANISIFETFKSDDENARIFVVRNDMIDQIKPLARLEALSLDGVKGRNHIRDFERYCSNIISSARELIRETQVNVAQFGDDEITFDKELNKPSDEPETVSPNINETENPFKPEEAGDKLEMERRKAHQNRAELKKLEKELEKIEEDAERRIAEIKNGQGQGIDD